MSLWRRIYKLGSLQNGCCGAFVIRLVGQHPHVHVHELELLCISGETPLPLYNRFHVRASSVLGLLCIVSMTEYTRTCVYKIHVHVHMQVHTTTTWCLIARCVSSGLQQGEQGEQEGGPSGRGGRGEGFRTRVYRRRPGNDQQSGDQPRGPPVRSRIYMHT